MFLFAFISIHAGVLAQAVTFRRLDAPPEMSNLENRRLFKDSDGLMWMGTNNGLYSYDGHTFKHYENPVEGDFIISDICEVNKKLWIGAWLGSGLWEFDKKTGKFTNGEDIPAFAPFFRHAYCVRQFQTDGSVVWMIATLNRRKGSVLVKYNTVTGQSDNCFFMNPPGFDRLEFNSFARTVHGGKETIWIATNGNGLYEFDPASRQYTIHRNRPGSAYTLSHNDVRNVSASGREPALWLCTVKGLNKFDLLTKRVTRLFLHDSENTNTLSNNELWAVQEAGEKLWVASEDGLNCLEPASGKVSRYKHRAAQPESVSHDFIRSFHYSQGLLWIATFGGVCVADLQPKNFAHYPFNPDDKNGFSGVNVNVLATGEDKNRAGVWLGTDNGLYFFDPLRKTFEKQLPDSPTTHSFYSIASENNSLWLETNAGFAQYDLSKRRLQFKPFLSHINDSLNKLETTGFAPPSVQDSQAIWMGSEQHGLTRLDVRNSQVTNYQPGTFNPASTGNGRQAGHITPLTAQGRRYVYFISSVAVVEGSAQASANCLVRLDPEKNAYTYYLRNPKKPGSLRAAHLTCLYNSGDSVLWMGSRKGLLEKFSVATGKFTHYHVGTDTRDISVFNVITDLKGNPWISTSTGVAKLDIRTNRIANYQSESPEGNPGVVTVRDKTGNIYQGTDEGLFVYHPDSIKTRLQWPPVMVTSFRIFDREHQADYSAAARDAIVLDHTQNFLSFAFAALNYRNPERNQYAYQMKGIDRNWVYAGNRRYVSYSNIAPGQYEFRIRSSNSDGVWNPRWTSMLVTVQPPWWQTWQSITLAAAVTGLSLLAAYRFRNSNVKWRQRRLEREVTARTAEVRWQNEEIAVQQAQLTRMNGYLKLLSDTLEDRVHLRTSELLKANAELRQKNDQIGQALAQGQTQERKRVAAELHDNLGGLLSALKLNMETINTNQFSEAEKQVYGNVLAMMTNACVEVRNISHNMLPEIFEKEGITTALQQLIHNVNGSGRIHFDLVFFGMENRLEKAIEVNLYSVCIELANNIIKHAQATTALIQIIRTTDEVTVMVEDNGRGLLANSAMDGIGLRNIRSRIETMNGTCRIDSSPGHGTTVTVEVPLKKIEVKTLKTN